MTNPVKLGNRCKTIDGERLSTNPKRVREHDSFSYCFFYFYRVFTEFSKRERNEETSGRVRPLAFFFPIWNFFFDFVSILRSCQSANRWSDAPARLSERVSRQSIRRYRVFFSLFIHWFIHSVLDGAPAPFWLVVAVVFICRTPMGRSVLLLSAVNLLVTELLPSFFFAHSYGRPSRVGPQQQEPTW